MDERPIAELTDEEMRAELKSLGLTMDADNCGRGLEVFREVLHSAANEYEPLI